MALTERTIGKVISYLPQPYRLRARTWYLVKRKMLGAELRRLGEYLPADRRGVALDIGANNGMIALLLSRLFKTVHAFEPNVEVVNEWRSAAPPGVQIWNVALSDDDSERTLQVPVVNGVSLDGWATLESFSIEVDDVHRQSVACRMLDSILPRETPVDFIKIDVEGHELSVLRGAESTLRTWKPWMVIESWDGQREAVVAYLDELGFQQVSLVGRMPPDERVNDLVFCPRTSQSTAACHAD